jgi:allophanate hydrolase subunit 2
VARGDAISIGDAVWNASRIDRPPCAVGAGPDYDADVIRVIAATAQPAADDDVRSAPQRNNAAVFEAFVATGYTVSAASDRTGYRLEGDRALDAADTSITSEPVCPGVIQLPPGGNPIVLMADSPTIGGYRILGTVISSDLPILAQSVPGRRLRFASVSVDVAQKMLRERRDQGVSEDM